MAFYVAMCLYKLKMNFNLSQRIRYSPQHLERSWYTCNRKIMTVFDSLKTQICEEATQYVFKKNAINYAEVRRTHLII